MKILIITQYFWPENCPVNQLALRLRERGHEIVVFTGMPNYPEGKFFTGYSFFSPRKEFYNGIKVLRAPLIPRGKNNKLLLILNYLSFALFSCLLAPFYCRGRYDLIFNYQTSPITASFPAILLKKIKKIPLFLWVQDLWPDSLVAVNAIKNRFLLRLLEIVVKFVYRNSDTILVQSQAFIEKIKKLSGKSDNEIRYFANWAEDIYYPRDQVEAEEISSEIPSGFIIMYGGNIGKAQAFDVILEAMLMLKQNPQLHWVIIGDGSEFAWLSKQVKMHGLSQQVRLLGKKAAARMPFYFAMADVLLVSLKSDPLFEITIPSKVQTYLASGKPILAILGGVGADIICEAKAGFVVPPGDVGRIVAVVARIVQMNERDLVQMGANGRQYYEKHFDWHVLLGRLEKLFSEKCRK